MPGRAWSVVDGKRGVEKGLGGGGAPSSKTKYLLCSCFVAKGGWVRSGEVGSGEVRADHKRCDVFVGVHRAYHNQTQE